MTDRRTLPPGTLKCVFLPPIGVVPDRICLRVQAVYAPPRCLDVNVTATLADLVRDRWSQLLDGDFTVANEEDGLVLLTSPEVRVVATHSPRGEVSVAVHRHDQEPWHGWFYEGVVGTASVGRLLELALDKMREDPAVLQGEQTLFSDLQERAVANAEAWTSYYAGEASRPERGQPLP